MRYYIGEGNDLHNHENDDGRAKVMEREFNIGDRVTIVDEPYKGCPFIWASDMDKYCSKDTVIVGKNWDYPEEAYYYEITADKGQYNWCAGCFKQNDDQDFEIASDEEMLEMLGINR